MKTKTARWIFSLSTIPILLLVVTVHDIPVLDAFWPKSAASGEVTAHAVVHGPTVACPAPFMANQSGVCELLNNEKITATISVPSNTVLDCKDFKLTANKPGTGIDVSTRSQPEVAILAVGSPTARLQKITIQNCSLADFDFGIVAMDVGVNYGDFSIMSNKINARFVGISLISVDKAQLWYNELTLKTTGGRGIYLGHDSDENQIYSNKISANLAVNVTPAVRFPGPVSSSNPAVDAGVGIVITHVEGDQPTLLNAVVDGRLYQHWVSENDSSNSNWVGYNNIVFPQDPTQAPNSTMDGILMAGANAFNTVSGNTVRRAKASIRVGLQTGTRDFVGNCSLNQTRKCLADSDCQIQNIDSASQGTCMSVRKPVSVRWISNSNGIYLNTILGPFATGITIGGENLILSENLIVGPFRTDGRGGLTAGIMLLGKYPLQTSTIVTRNLVMNVPVALSLQKVLAVPGVTPEAPTAFTARVYGNDFIGYTTAVRTSNDYDLKSDLWFTTTDSQGNLVYQGNYWGLPCAMNGFNRSSVVKVDGLVNLLAEIKDGHPYEEPVAKAPDWPLSFPPTWGYPRPCY